MKAIGGKNVPLEVKEGVKHHEGVGWCRNSLTSTATTTAPARTDHRLSGLSLSEHVHSTCPIL